MIKVFITLVLCSCMKEKIWPTTNNGFVDNNPTTNPPCSHDSTPIISSSIDNTTSITSLQADNITLTSLPFDEIPSTTSLPVSNIISTVSFPVVNITSTPTASIYNITRLSPEVVDHTPFTTELANDIPTVIKLVDNVTSITPSLIETVTSKTTEFINVTSLTITELSNHITSSPEEFLDNITSVTPSSVSNTSSMSTKFIDNFILTTTNLVNHINSVSESAINTSTIPLLIDNITSSIAGFNVDNTSSTTELVNNSLLTTILLPVNDITLTTSSPYNFTSSTEGILDNVTSTTGETFDNSILMTKSVNNTTSTTESVNNIISMTSSPFNFSSTRDEIIDNITLVTMKTLDNTTSTTKDVDNITTPPSLKLTEEIIDNATLTTIKFFDNTKPMTLVSVDDSAISSLLPSDSSISSELSYGHSEILATLSPTYNPTSAPRPKYASKKFRVYWNVPTFVCHRHGINFEDISKFGIIQNINDTFRGKDVAILYDPGLFPALIKSSNGSNTIRNGGVPQKGDLQKHLKAFKKDIDSQIDVNFSGVGIIDFEHWRPILRLNWAALHQYRKYSYEIEKEENSDLDEAETQKLASEKFEKHARAFMEETIKLAKALRPKASWSYYGFPWCNNLTPQHKSTQCHPMLIENNDDIQWLWNQENILLPSIYIPMSLSSDKRVGLINGRLNEAQRIARKTNSRPKILPYFWFKYRDHHDVFLSRDDLISALKEMLTQNIDGFILWGSSNDVNTKEKCQQVDNYINQVFGPLVKDIIINQRVVSNEVFEK